MVAYEIDFDRVDFGIIAPPASADVAGDDVFHPGDGRPTVRNVGDVALRLGIAFGPMADETGTATIEDFRAGFLGEERAFKAGERLVFSNSLLPSMAAAIDFQIEPPAGTAEGTYVGSLCITAESAVTPPPAPESTGTPTGTPVVAPTPTATPEPTQGPVPVDSVTPTPPPPTATHS